MGEGETNCSLGVFPTSSLPHLHKLADLETIEVLKTLASVNRSLAELKGRAAAIPNQGILIDKLALQEAKASLEIENIVTTQDELFQAELFPEGPESSAAKEVAVKWLVPKSNYRVHSPVFRL
ncbi:MULTISPECIES: Fic/DOC family N-terminal domain-containing protein [Rhizobium]|uniref:Fic/DOC family protein n=1 Tax=Rhizobium azibense TaxID=1136135 RepID=A0A4R3RJW0_9HYPH|nr:MULTISPECIES: Fic/DOC family N-terminal domain-containing protein [Rhizobium]TCU36048.1 Fic/DOC family protein [Rhizobium azibense]